MIWPRIVLGVSAGLIALGQVALGSEQAGVYQAYSFCGGFGAGYGRFRFAGGLAESGLAYNLNAAARIYHRFSLGLEIGMWSPKPGSESGLKLDYPTAFLSYSLSNRLIARAGAAFVSLQGELDTPSGSWGGTDTSPGLALGLGYDVSLGEGVSLVPCVQWVHQKVDDEWDQEGPPVDTESASNYVSVVANIWFH